MAFPSSSSRLLAAAVHGVYILSDKGIVELFTSGSNGIAAATRTQAQDDFLAIADSHVVILHNIKQRMQRTYRLRNSGPPRQLWYDKKNDQLLFTTTLENAVQVYSLRCQRFMDPATSHPSPPVLFTVHSSSSLNLLLSASAKPPTVYITALDGDRKRARYLVQPHTWSAVCSAAAFHPAVGPGTDTILFVLGFTDGTITAYSYSSNDLPVRLAHVAGAHITTAEKSPSRIPSLTRLTKENRSVCVPAATSGSPEVGDTASAVIAIGLIPGFLCLGASVGSDGCCCITDFEPDTGPEIKVRWSLYGAATALAVNKDMVAIGLATGKVNIYSVTGDQLFSHEFDGHKIVSLEWIYKPVPPVPSIGQADKLLKSIYDHPLGKDDNLSCTAHVLYRRPPSTSSTNTDVHTLSRPRLQMGSSCQGSAGEIESSAPLHLSNEGHRASPSHLRAPSVPSGSRRTSGKMIKNETQASTLVEEHKLSSPVALDGVKEKPGAEQVKVIGQLSKLHKSPVLLRDSSCASEYSDDYVLEWSYANTANSTAEALSARESTRLLGLDDTNSDTNATCSIPTSHPSQRRRSAEASMLAVPNRHLRKHWAPSTSATTHSAPLGLVAPGSVDSSEPWSSQVMMQSIVPKITEMSSHDIVLVRNPVSTDKKPSEVQKLQRTSPQSCNAEASTPIRIRKQESVELRLSDTRSAYHSQANAPPILRPSTATESLCRHCQSTVTPTALSGGSSSFTTASSGRHLMLSELKFELRLEHDRAMKEIEAVMTLYEQRIGNIIERFME